MVLIKIINRDTFNPPPVLPAQAPINMRKTKVLLLVVDHRLKSAVAKPVVVIIEETWKKESLRAAPIVG